MFELPIQPSSIVLEIGNVHAIILIKQDDNSTDWVISDNESENPGESTLSSDIEDDDLDNQQEDRHLDQARRNETIQTSMVPLPKKPGHSDTVIACTLLPNLQHPAGAIAPPLLKLQESTINISHKSDIVQALLFPKASRVQNVPQPKAGGGDHNIPQYQKATFEIVKRFMEAIILTRTPWPIISDEKYSMVDEAWQLAIEAQDR